MTVCTTDVVSRYARIPAAQRVTTTTPGKGPPITVRVFPNVSNRAAYHWQFFLPRGLQGFLRHYVHELNLAHLHACHNFPTSVGANACRNAGVPYIVSPHGTAPLIERRRMAKWLFDAIFDRHLLRDAAQVLAVSAAERTQLAAMGVPGDRIRTIPNPIDLKAFEQPATRGVFRRAWGLGTAPIVMFLGKLTPRKRLDVLVRAFSLLNRPAARLVIAGNDMGSEPRLRRVLAQLDLSSRVIFTGLLEGHSRLDALADADVVAYPSTDEVFGLVPLEALLSGTPVAVANDSGCGDLIERVGGGLTVVPGDATALAEALRTILDQPMEWRTAAHAADRRVRSLCDPAAIAEQLEGVYREVVEPLVVRAAFRRGARGRGPPVRQVW